MLGLRAGHEHPPPSFPQLPLPRFFKPGSDPARPSTLLSLSTSAPLSPPFSFEQNYRFCTVFVTGFQPAARRRPRDPYCPHGLFMLHRHPHCHRLPFISSSSSFIVSPSVQSSSSSSSFLLYRRPCSLSSLAVIGNIVISVIIVIILTHQQLSSVIFIVTSSSP